MDICFSITPDKDQKLYFKNKILTQSVFLTAEISISELRVLRASAQFFSSRICEILFFTNLSLILTIKLLYRIG